MVKLFYQWLGHVQKRISLRYPLRWGGGLVISIFVFFLLHIADFLLVPHNSILCRYERVVFDMPLSFYIFFCVVILYTEIQHKVSHVRKTMMADCYLISTVYLGTNRMDVETLDLIEDIAYCIIKQQIVILN